MPAGFSSFFDGARDWGIAVDLNGHGIYPEVICELGLRPDSVLHSRLTRQVVLIELTVLWEPRIEEHLWELRIEEQHVFKLVKSADLVA